MTNKVLRPGDKILLQKRKMSGSQLLNGHLFEIVSGNSSQRSFRAKLLEDISGHFSTGKVIDVYTEGSGQDDFVEADKVEMIKHFTAKRDKLEEEMALINAEIEFYTKYDSMEEFVADKIGLLVQADTKESRVAILKTLKQSNYL